MRTPFRNTWQCAVLLGLLSSWNAGAQDESLVKMNQLERLPRSTDLRSDAKKEPGAKWKVQLPKVHLVSPSEQSAISSYSSSVDLNARSSAVSLWDSSGKQIRNPTE